MSSSSTTRQIRFNAIDMNCVDQEACRAGPSPYGRRLTRSGQAIPAGLPHGLVTCLTCLQDRIGESCSMTRVRDLRTASHLGFTFTGCV